VTFLARRPTYVARQATCPCSRYAASPRCGFFPQGTGIPLSLLPGLEEPPRITEQPSVHSL
jgi:hypothetical protein